MAIRAPEQSTVGRNGHQTPQEETEHVLILQSPYGLERHPWTPRDAAAVGRAAEAFERYRALGFRLYRTAPGGKPAEEITRFDPEAREIIGIMPMRGGCVS